MQAKIILTAVAVLLAAGMAQADVFNMGGTRNPTTGTWTGLASLETVTVGNPGNAADDTGYGAVAYTYGIGKYEVTAGQYAAFLNAVAKTDTYGLYNNSMDSSSYGCQITRHGSSGNYTYDFSGRPSGTEANWVNRPVNYVSFWDACRFSNWLQNGQPTGTQDANTTERGAYTLDGYIGSDGRTIQRSANATWAVTGEDEWYKAAYYKGGATNAGYFDYPTGSDTLPGRDMADASGNNANYDGACGSPYWRTEAGELKNSDSPYGTFDQGGNVHEWNEAVLNSPHRVTRGGSLGLYNDPYLTAAVRNDYSPSGEDYTIGFRVVDVPEPCTLSLLALGGLAILRRRLGTSCSI